MMVDEITRARSSRWRWRETGGRETWCRDSASSRGAGGPGDGARRAPEVAARRVWIRQGAQRRALHGSPGGRRARDELLLQDPAGSVETMCNTCTYDTNDGRSCAWMDRLVLYAFHATRAAAALDAFNPSRIAHRRARSSRWSENQRARKHVGTGYTLWRTPFPRRVETKAPTTRRVRANSVIQSQTHA